MGQKGTQHHIDEEKSTFTLAAAPIGQQNCDRLLVRVALACP